MTTARLETFSDAVIAIILTIGVLSLRLPEDISVASMLSIAPSILIYAWSFQVIGTYWINHHHLIQGIKVPTVAVMWSNLTLLFFLSLIPFTTEWLGMHPLSALPSFVYCFVLLCAGLSYTALDLASITCKGYTFKSYMVWRERIKGIFSISMYALAVISSLFFPLFSYILVGLVSLIWLVPTSRTRFIDSLHPTTPAK